MARTIFAAGTLTATGQPYACTVHRSAVTTAQETDLHDTTYPLPGSGLDRGIITVSSTGAYSSFIGPDDVGELWLAPTTGASRVKVTGSSLVSGSAEAAAFVQRSSAEAPAPLAGIRKATTGAYRIMVTGTSVANAAYAPQWRVIQALRQEYGDTCMTRVRSAELGGAYTVYRGWYGQNYGGPTYIRRRGSSSSQALTFIGYGDEVMVEWSRESDSAATEVLVDGVSVGTFGASGSQKYGMQTKFTGLTKSAHAVTINAPASGYCYLEAIEIRDSTRRGVEVIDATLGGSSLARAALTNPAGGDQVTTIATEPGSGIEAIYGRDDVDLIIHSHTLNDAGNGTDDTSATFYRTLLNQACRASRRKAIPMILQIEPAGGYSLTNLNGSPSWNARYEAIKAAQLAAPATWPHVSVVDWDTDTRITPASTYASTWYGATNVNTTAGTYSGDFTHPDGSYATSAQDIGAATFARTVGFTGYVGTAKTAELAQLADVGKPSSGFFPLAPGTGGTFAKRIGTVYRDTTATNLANWNTALISPAATSDANGKYYLASPNALLALGSTSGQSLMFVARIGPTDAGACAISATYADVQLLDLDGVQMDPAGTSGQFQWTGLAAGTIFTVAFIAKPQANGKFLLLSGRFYDVAMTTKRLPTLCATPV